MTRPAIADLAVGQSVGTRTVEVRRVDLVRYAGASKDFNTIHWNDRIAREVGLPGVIAHGMFTMGQAVNVVTDWGGDPGAIVDYGVRFTRPGPVPAPGGAVVDVEAVIGAIDEVAGTVRVDLTVTFEGAKVLGKAQVVVALA